MATRGCKDCANPDRSCTRTSGPLHSPQAAALSPAVPAPVTASGFDPDERVVFRSAADWERLPVWFRERAAAAEGALGRALSGTGSLLAARAEQERFGGYVRGAGAASPAGARDTILAALKEAQGLHPSSRLRVVPSASLYVLAALAPSSALPYRQGVAWDDRLRGDEVVVVDGRGTEVYRTRAVPCGMGPGDVEVYRVLVRDGASPRRARDLARRLLG